MKRPLGVSLLLLSALAAGQTNPHNDKPKPDSPPSASQLPPNDAPPRSDTSDDGAFSSSRDTIIDLRPPNGDLKEHPNSSAAMAKATADETAEQSAADVQEFHQWNPMKALKDVEVGDYYFKRKNYRAALDRYQEALFYKENDAEATYRLAVCQEKVSDKPGALDHYTAYLKILPHGPYAEEAKASIDRLGGEMPKEVPKESPAKKETADQTPTPEKP